MKIWKKLKSIEQLGTEHPGSWNDVGGETEYWNFDEDFHWIINNEMQPKFGDGNYYQFEEIDDHISYTHKCEDDWYYSELWFEDEVVDFGISEVDWEF